MFVRPLLKYAISIQVNSGILPLRSLKKSFTKKWKNLFSDVYSKSSIVIFFCNFAIENNVSTTYLLSSQGRPFQIALSIALYSFFTSSFSLTLFGVILLLLANFCIIDAGISGYYQNFSLVISNSLNASSEFFKVNLIQFKFSYRVKSLKLIYVFDLPLALYRSSL